MKSSTPVFKTGRAEAWTAERLQQLGKQELLQLQANAERLAEAELAARCGEALKSLPRRTAAARPAAGAPAAARKVKAKP
jgi:hypothetical protein